jgi:hypothetical protein
MLKSHEVLSELRAARAHRRFRRQRPIRVPRLPPACPQTCKPLKNYTKGQETQM